MSDEDRRVLGVVMTEIGGTPDNAIQWAQRVGKALDRLAELEEILQSAIDWYGTSWEGDPPEPSWLRDARRLFPSPAPQERT